MQETRRISFTRDAGPVLLAAAALATACGPTSSSSGSPASGSAAGVAGTAVSGGAPGAGPVATGGTPSVPSSGGTSAAVGGAVSSSAGGSSSILPTSAGGTSGGGSSGAPVGGNGGAAVGNPTAGPAPYKLTIAIPSVPAGAEDTRCIQTRLPNTAPISVNKLHNTLSEGSHHFIVSSLTASNAMEMPLTPCKPFRAALQGGPLAITQKKDDTVVTPPGVGYSLDQNQLVSLELHYINTSTDTLDIQAETEIYPADAGANLQPSTVELVGTTNVSIAPMASASTGPRFIAMPSQLDGVSYFAITGHTHRFGTAVKVSAAASATASPTSLYAPTPYAWDSPPMQQLSPAVQVPSGGGFVLQCDWQNTTNSAITWGESALNEMCFFWAYYYPKKTVSNLILEGIGPVDPSVILGLGI